MSKSVKSFTPREDGSRVPYSTKKYFGEQLDAAVKEIYRDLNPLLEWHEKHIQRLRIPSGFYAPITIIGWELFKHFVLGKPL